MMLATMTPTMNKVKFLFAIMFSVSVCFVQAAEEPTQLLKEARQLVKAYTGELKPQLQQALQAGGPAHAIAVCAQQAPLIAARLSQSSGWKIKRVSLKPRNVGSATPDAWERKALLEFDRQLAEGKAVSAMYVSVNDEGTFRYMQPQAVETVCLVCHGEMLSNEVKQALKNYAPGDQARGYKLGEIRGAFSLRKLAPETKVSF